MGGRTGRCGTNRSYVLGCRCEACVAAAAVVRERHRASKVKLPVEPLLKLLTAEQRQSCKKTLERYERVGMTPYQADRMCCRFGWHPWLVFGDLWFADLWLKMEAKR